MVELVATFSFFFTAGHLLNVKEIQFVDRNALLRCVVIY